MEEEHFRRVEFGMASLQRCHSLSCQTEEIRPIDALSSGLRGREKPRRRSTNSWRLPEAEMPAMPEQAMEFLSRTWSPCSSHLLQILSPASTSRRPGMLLVPASSAPEDDGEPADEASKDEEKSTVRLESGRGQSLLDGTRVLQDAVVARGTPRRPPVPRRNKLTQPTTSTSWQLNGGYMIRAILGRFLLSAVSITGSQRRQRRRDELRLHAAQAHAAVSVAQLAAAVAGTVSAYELRPPAPSAIARGPADPVAAAGDSGRRTGAVLASAAALVATVCAEAAAERGRVDAARVASAVRAGRESRSPAELLALTATAATSLRGAAALELRAADVRGIGSTNPASVRASLHKGTALRVCLPCGKVRVRTVAVFPHGTVVVLRLGKNLLRGAFITYKEYELLAVSGGAGSGGEAVVEGRHFFPLALSTTGGVTVQLLFEHQTHCKVWTASVQGMLFEHNLKHPI